MPSVTKTSQTGKQVPPIILLGRDGSPLSDRGLKALSRLGLLEKINQLAAAECSRGGDASSCNQSSVDEFTRKAASVVAEVAGDR